jgi:TATA-box binding protein (TBP) (component of TFIID and TFIIIB)
MNLNNSENCPVPTKLRISTMTATCNLNNEINLELIYNKLDITSFVTFIEYANYPIKGFNPKSISDKKANKKKVFYNQITIILQLTPGVKINIKIFNNGAASITGIKDADIAKESINKLCDIFNSVINDQNLVYKLTDFDIVLINSDYHIGYQIKRDELHKILINNCKLCSSYEPCIYPGVNSKFFWNSTEIDSSFPGKCVCSKSCNGKGNGIGDGKCKKITISTFQSGSVIITGARNMQQIKDSYNFINGVFKKYYSVLKKTNAPFLEFEEPTFTPKTTKKDNIIYLKKSNIKYQSVK